MNLESVKEAVLPRWMEDHPLTKKIKADEVAAILSKRKAAAERIEAIKKEYGNLPAKQNEIDEMIERIAMLDKDRAELEAAINLKRQAIMIEKNGIESDIKQEEEILLATYDPALDEIEKFFHDKFEELRRPGKVSCRGMDVERNLFTGKKIVTVESNESAVLAAMQYCRSAIKRVGEMRLLPEFPQEELQKMKDALPSIDVWQEVTGQKPAWPRIDTDPRSQFRSDSQMDWEIGKLNEKFKKLMRK
jgi:hypothetical protein